MPSSPLLRPNSMPASQFRREHTMHWTKWTWLALAGFALVALIACILFAPDLMTLRQ